MSSPSYTISNNGFGSSPSSQPAWKRAEIITRPDMLVDPVSNEPVTWSGTPKWGTPTLGTAAEVTYGFRESTAGLSPSPESNSFWKFQPAQMDAARMAMKGWSDVANIIFKPGDDPDHDGYTNQADMLFANYSANDGKGAHGGHPGPNAGGDVWVNAWSGWGGSPTSYGTDAYLTFIHEIGHAIGLSHPGLYRAGKNPDGTDIAISYAKDAAYSQDSKQYTVMSYFEASNTGANYTNGVLIEPSTPMLDDIAAVQLLYGANFSTRSGFTIYGFHSNAGEPYLLTTSTEQVVMTIWDGGGSDTLDFSGYGSDQRISLVPGTFSDVGALRQNVAVAYSSDSRAWIENAIGGTGNDTLIGNDTANLLEGRGGNDTFLGGLGDDVLLGGEGADTASYMTDTTGIVVDLTPTTALAFSGHIPLYGGTARGAAIGNDFLNSIENVNGGTAADKITGDVHDNVLRGGGGVDTLNGGEGNDTLIGGTGDDTINGGGGSKDTASYADMWQPVIVNLMGDPVYVRNFVYYGDAYARGIDAGNDTLYGIENVIGGNSDDTITGDYNANRLEGGNGKDTLSGMGGQDVLVGGAGNDTLNGGADNDTVDYSATKLGVTVYLDSHLGPTGLSASPSADGAEIGSDRLISIENVIGGAGRDAIYGTAGSNDIDGGAGIDDMWGGRENDTYHVADAVGGGFSGQPLEIDRVHELPGQGTDTVYSAIWGYTLPDNVENLVLVDGPLSLGLAGYGNALANTITGTANTDFIEGRGDNDILIGNAGPDTLIGGQGADQIYTNGITNFGNDSARDIIVYSALSDSTPTARDTIYGFVAGSAATADRFNFSGLDANPATATIDAFKVVPHLTGARGEIELSIHGADTWILVNGDANPGVDMTIVVAGVTGLTAGDLLLH